MEDTLREYKYYLKEDLAKVLILVLMEDTLRVAANPTATNQQVWS